MGLFILDRGRHSRKGLGIRELDTWNLSKRFGEWEVLPPEVACLEKEAFRNCVPLAIRMWETELGKGGDGQGAAVST